MAASRSRPAAAAEEPNRRADLVRAAGRLFHQKGYAATDNKNAVAIRNGTRAVLRLLADLMPEPVKGRPVIEEEYEPLMLPNFATPGTPEFDSYQRLLEEHERRKAQDQGG